MEDSSKERKIGIVVYDDLNNPHMVEADHETIMDKVEHKKENKKFVLNICLYQSLIFLFSRPFHFFVTEIRISSKIIRISATVIRISDTVIRISVTVIRIIATFFRISAIVIRISVTFIRISAVIIRICATVIRISLYFFKGFSTVSVLMQYVVFVNLVGPSSSL